MLLIKFAGFGVAGKIDTEAVDRLLRTLAHSRRPHRVAVLELSQSASQANSIELCD